MNSNISKLDSSFPLSSCERPPVVDYQQPTQQTNKDSTNTTTSTSDTETVNISTSTTEAPIISNIPNATVEPATSAVTKTKATSPPNRPPPLVNDFLTVLSDYTDILSRIERENTGLLTAHRLIETSRARMARAFDDVAKARQHMARLFERAREQQIQQGQQEQTQQAQKKQQKASDARAGSDDADAMKALQLEARRWEIMRGYERLYHERKRVEHEMLSMEKEKERRVDGEWVLAMFSRVAEKGLFEAPVVVHRRERREEDEGHEGGMGGEDGDDEEEETTEEQ